VGWLSPAGHQYQIGGGKQVRQSGWRAVLNTSQSSSWPSGPRNRSESAARIWRMASEVPPERLVIVDMGDVQVVAHPDSFEGPPDIVADSSKTAQWSFSFSVSEAALLAGLQADFLRPL